MKGHTKLHLDNIRYLLKNIRDLAPITMKELREITHYSYSTHSLIINKLLEKGYIVCSEKVETSAGRKPQKYDINPNNNYIIGIDLVHGYLLLVVTDLRGIIYHKAQVSMARVDRDTVLDKIYSMLDETLQLLPNKTILYIAVSIQGISDTERGISKIIAFYSNWHDVPLKDLLEARYHIPTMLIHDPDCSIRAEMSFGHLKHLDSVSLLFIRMEKHGLGMSIMTNGQVYTGVHGTAGEIGRIPVPYKNDQGYIYLEDIYPEANFVRNYQKITGCKEITSYDDIAALVRKGDPTATDMFRQIIDILGIAWVILVNSFNPEYLILGGNFCEYRDLFENRFNEILKNNAYDNTVKLVISSQDCYSAAVGAALWASDHFIDTLTDID